MKLSNESIAAIEALAPDEFELFENLIRRTNFLRAFEHILKAREYLKEWDEREPKNCHGKQRKSAKNKLTHWIFRKDIFVCRSFGLQMQSITLRYVVLMMQSGNSGKGI